MPKGYSRKAELLPEAQKLRAQGMYPAEISRRLGIPRGTIKQWLDPESLEKQKQRRRERYAGRCVDCGNPTNGSCGYRSCAIRCAECSWKHQHEQRYWTRQRIIGAIQRWAHEHGRPPRADEWVRAGASHPARSNVYRTRGRSKEHNPFATWAEAIEAAGFPRPRKGHYVRTPEHLARLRTPRIPTEELIENIREASENGVAPSTEVLHREYSLLFRRGISWPEACELAGVQPRMTAGWRKRLKV